MLADFVTVRQARPRDATALATVFRDSWLLAYRGIIPHGHLNAMIARRGHSWWRENVSRQGNLMVLEAGGNVVGYSSFGPSRIVGKPRGEIYELYLAPEHQGLGLGERLFESTRQRLDELGLDGLLVWALTDNDAACDFYWRRGGRAIGRTTERFGGKVLGKTGFGWD